MRLNDWQVARDLMLYVSMLLPPGCAMLSPSPVSVPAPAIPPLSQESRQPPLNPICSPTCSERLRIDYEDWLGKLTNAALPAPAASVPTNP